MSKYIIDIVDMPYQNDGDGKKLYRARYFNSLVFDEDGLDKLEKYEQIQKEDLADAYQDGLRDAWWAAKRIVLGANRGGLTYEELNSIFGTPCDGINTTFGVLTHYSADEAVELISHYEEQAKKDVRDLQKVKALADEIGIHRLYSIAKEIRGE